MNVPVFFAAFVAAFATVMLIAFFNRPRKP